MILKSPLSPPRTSLGWLKIFKKIFCKIFKFFSKSIGFYEVIKSYELIISYKFTKSYGFTKFYKVIKSYKLTNFHKLKNNIQTIKKDSPQGVLKILFISTCQLQKLSLVFLYCECLLRQECCSKPRILH